MKKVIVLVFVMLSMFQGMAQYVNIPDPGLRSYLLQRIPACFNASQQMDTTCNEVLGTLDITLFGNNVLSLDGLQYFDNLLEITIGNSLMDSIHLAHLPAGLKTLSLTQFYRLKNVDGLPGGLITLNFNSIDSLEQLPDLPASLESLNATNCHQLTGLPALPAGLKNINCSQQYSSFGLPALINSLPPLPAGLLSLRIDECSIGTLPTLPATLSALSCINTGISSLPNLPGTLTNLVCDRNSLTQLPDLPSSLIYFSANFNNLSGLPVLPQNVTSLYVTNNQLTSLPDIPPALNTLYVGNNQLTSIPVLPATLEFLFCNVNQLQQLPALGHTNLVYLNCSQNQLVSLPTLPSNLDILKASYNQITQLPALPSSLSELACDNNQLQSIASFPIFLNRISLGVNPYLFCLPLLPTYCSELLIDSRIRCLPAQQPSGCQIFVYDDFGVFDTSYYPPSNYMPVCNPTNNAGQCHAYPLIKGFVYHDNNLNNVRDINEPVSTNVQLTLSNGRRAFTDNNGYFEIYADSLLSYSLSAVPPAFFNCLPVQYNYLFSTYDTVISNDFALQPNTVADSLQVGIFPLQAFARPGFPYNYQVKLDNLGTTTLSPTLNMPYDAGRLAFDSVSDPAVLHTMGNLQINYPALVAGGHRQFNAYFHVLPSAILGDTIRAVAAAVAGTLTVTDTSYVIIRGSFDPNDKQSTPVLSPAEVSAGKYVDYIIRFQNTGTDTAFNVVISDTLSNLLSAGSFQMTGASHPCKTTIRNNIVYFEFINILLPDSNVNEAASHGYASFRIRPQASVTLGTQIPNKAAIYFDYNSPVITNVAVTVIANPLSPVPLSLLNFQVRQREDGLADFTWVTADEQNTAGFRIEMSLDGSRFSDIAQTSAKGRAYNSYDLRARIPTANMLYFRLKMLDIDQRYSYSWVIVLRKDKPGDLIHFLENPVRDQLTLSLPQDQLPVIARILSMDGMLLRKINVQNSPAFIFVGDLPAGTYILQAGGNSKSFVIRR